MLLSFTPDLPESLEKNERYRIAVKLKNIIEETFILTADDDYINARFLAISGMHRAFYWAAAQAVEKYLKANLLYRNKSVKDYNHKIQEMVQELKRHDPNFSKLTLTPPKKLKEVEENNLWGSSSLGNFIEHVSQFGSPDNRYDHFGANYEAAHIFKLDILVYYLRKCVSNLELLKDTPVKKKHSHYAFDNNYCFAPSGYKHSPIYEILSFRLRVPTIEMALKKCYGNYSVYKKWLEENLKINTSIKYYKK
jgi:hypothetical protein